MKVALAWVDTLLSRWGRWSIRQGNGALGFAKCSILAGAGEGEGHYDPAPPPDVTNEDFDAVTDAVMNLLVVELACVVQVYIRGAGWSDERNAHALGITRKMLTQYINVAHRKIALDISLKEPQNCTQSANGGNAPERIQPVPARA